MPITGIAQQHQVLRLFRSSEAAEKNEAPVATMTDESQSLGAYGLQEWNCIKVGGMSLCDSELTKQVDNTDPNARPGEFSDLSAVDKFELTKEEYEARPGRSSVVLSAIHLLMPLQTPSWHTSRRTRWAALPTFPRPSRTLLPLPPRFLPMSSPAPAARSCPATATLPSAAPCGSSARQRLRVVASGSASSSMSLWGRVMAGEFTSRTVSASSRAMDADSR